MSQQRDMSLLSRLSFAVLPIPLRYDEMYKYRLLNILQVIYK
jgi:hypothetical protein